MPLAEEFRHLGATSIVADRSWVLQPNLKRWEEFHRAAWVFTRRPCARNAVAADGRGESSVHEGLRRKDRIAAAQVRMGASCAQQGSRSVNFDDVISPQVMTESSQGRHTFRSARNLLQVERTAG